MAFRSQPSHLPLDSDSSTRFLPSIVALMVALLTFSIVGLAALHDSVGKWSGQIEGSLSIQVPPTGMADRDPEEREQALQATVDDIIEQLADMPGIDSEWLESTDGLQVLAGNAIPEGSDPIATVYAAHQFGNWNPQLGDGRAVLLGEVISKDGVRYDLQLKGSGPTPYSRGGDGRAHETDSYLVCRLLLEQKHTHPSACAV